MKSMFSNSSVFVTLKECLTDILALFDWATMLYKYVRSSSTTVFCRCPQ